MGISTDIRNNVLIRWLVQLTETDYAGQIDFIGLTGSCAAGKEDEYSDLDLVIIANENAEKTIGECFLVDWDGIRIGYDFYTMSWKRVENMAGTTWASHIADVVPLWYADDIVKNRWMELVKRQQEIMAQPLSEKQIHTAEESLKQAKQLLADIFLTEEILWAKDRLTGMMLMLTDVICVLNNTYYKYGIKDRIAEIEQMETPDNFMQLWHEAMDAERMEEIRIVAVSACRVTEQFWKDNKETVMALKMEELRRDPGTVDGWYEEFFSNYKNKVVRLLEQNDREMACLVSFCAQNFLEELEANTGMPMPVLYRDLDVKNLKKLAQGFERVEQEILAEYHARGLEADLRDYKKL